MVLGAVPGSGASLVRKLAELADAAATAAEAYAEELRRLTARISMLEARLDKMEKNGISPTERYSYDSSHTRHREWEDIGDAGTGRAD
jgi:hypothetical protein